MIGILEILDVCKLSLGVQGVWGGSGGREWRKGGGRGEFTPMKTLVIVLSCRAVSYMYNVYHTYIHTCYS